MPKKPSCDLCGSSRCKVDHYVGGCIRYAHKKCAEIGERAIKRYEEFQRFQNWLKKNYQKL